MLDKSHKIDFTDNMAVQNGAHVLYNFINEDIYMDKVLSFILTGLKFGHGVILVDRPERYFTVRQKLLGLGLTVEMLENIVYYDSFKFYMYDELIDFPTISNTFNELITPLLEKGLTNIRAWTNVEIRDYDSVLDKLIDHEKNGDTFISESMTKFLIVCAYAGRSLSSIAQIELMKVHQYLMTDHKLYYSSLYYKSNATWTHTNSNLDYSITKLNSYQEELIRVERLELVHQMAASISHEIRNPMTTVRGFLQVLSKKDECVKFQDYFALMIEELDRANSIITEFLSLSNTTPQGLELFDLNSIINNIAPLIHSEAICQTKNLIIHTEGVLQLPLNRNEIRQLVINLCKNGLEAMATGKNLTISTYREDDCIVLAIQDEGQGIKPEILEKLGTPFFTTKAEGTGLGLSVCYSIAKRHHAKIAIKTGQNGTTFLVKFSIH